MEELVDERIHSLGALKDDLKRIKASCEFISGSLSAALARSPLLRYIPEKGKNNEKN